MKDLQDGIVKLEKLLSEHGGHSKLEHAKHLCYQVLPAMAAVRKTADTLEGIVADDLWPLATYQEMLFIMLISVREQTAYATSTRRSQAPR
ncbi:MAG: hypothetical protein ABSC63_16275 [Candidatus Binataceae bacterium]